MLIFSYVVSLGFYGCIAARRVCQEEAAGVRREVEMEHQDHEDDQGGVDQEEKQGDGEEQAQYEGHGEV